MFLVHTLMCVYAYTCKYIIAEMSLGKVCYVAVYMILIELLIVECAYSQRTYFRILSPI